MSIELHSRLTINIKVLNKVIKISNKLFKQKKLNNILETTTLESFTLNDVAYQKQKEKKNNSLKTLDTKL